jgi:hypothetical protein
MNNYSVRILDADAPDGLGIASNFLTDAGRMISLAFGSGRMAPMAGIDPARFRDTLEVSHREMRFKEINQINGDLLETSGPPVSS